MDNRIAVFYVNRMRGTRSPANVWSGDPAVAMVSGEEPVSVSRIPTWGRQLCSRQGVQDDPVISGMAAPQGNVSADNDNVWEMCSGPIRYQAQRPTRSVCELETRPKCNRNRWISYAFPPFCLIGRCLRKVREEKASLVLVAPIWRSQSWYPALLELLIDLPLPPTRQPGTIDGPLRRPTPVAGIGTTTASRLEAITSRQFATGISAETSQLLAAGWSTGKNTAYLSAWKR